MDEQTQDKKITQKVLTNLKIVNDLEDDDSRIKKINVYIENAMDEIKLYVGVDEIDSELAVIVQKMAQNAITQESFEGTKSASEEGLSLTFQDTDLDQVRDMLNRYIDNLKSNSHRGWAMSFD